MDKDLKNYKLFIEKEVCKIEHEIKKAKNETVKKLIEKRAAKLSSYHENTIKNFQHERFIHLFVTLFFAGLLLLSLAVSLSFVILPFSDNIQTLLNLSLCASFILLVIEICYIRHYYLLENNTQLLYKFSKRLFEAAYDRSTVDTKTQAR